MAQLDDAQIEQALSGMDGWRREGDAIVKEYAFDDFQAALGFVNDVAVVAEERNHHPDILIHGWNKVRLTVSNHSEGGISQACVELAQSL